MFKLQFTNFTTWGAPRHFAIVLARNSLSSVIVEVMAATALIHEISLLSDDEELHSVMMVVGTANRILDRLIS